MSSSLRSSYRRVLREVYKSSIHPRNVRNPSVLLSFRKIFSDGAQSDAAADTLTKQMEHAVVFMKGQREYSDLLKRYNPLHDVSPDDHRLATARRVGLDMPREYDSQTNGEGSTSSSGSS